MKLSIDDIRVGERRRKDMGDLSALAHSIADIGLLHPVVVTPDRALIAGKRRLEACRLMGWDTIEVTIATNLDDATRALKAERDENTCRKDFAPSEAVALGGALEAIEGLAAKERMLSGTPCGNLPQGGNGKTRDKVGTAVGMSGKTYEKAKKVIEAAKKQPERFAEIAEAMDKTGNVDRAFKAIKQEQHRAEIKSVTLEEAVYGKYTVIYADPPWSYNNSGFDQSASNTYPTMPTSEICAMPVTDLLTGNAVLFLWVTSPLLPDGLEVMQAWGFTYKASMVWIKNRAPGMGFWVQTYHELLLIGERGSMKPAQKPPSVVTEDVTTHSKKPSTVYEIIEGMYPDLPKLELFARAERQGWEAFGNEI
jgi:N6-adenosine-specific RNA methylase IME4